MIIEQCEQNSEEWFRIKAGKPSASKCDNIITSRGEVSKQRQKYLYQLAGEAIIGIKEKNYQSVAMEEGIEKESEARRLYEMLMDVEVKQVGVCYHDEQKEFLCSPDGLVGENGGLEIKSPLMHTHIAYLLDNKIPTVYYCQVQCSLYVTGREFWDFMSYYPGLPPLIIRAERDEDFITKLDVEMKRFIIDLKDVIEKIKKA